MTRLEPVDENNIVGKLIVKIENREHLCYAFVFRENFLRLIIILSIIYYIYSGDEILKMLVTIVGQEMMKIQGR